MQWNIDQEYSSCVVYVIVVHHSLSYQKPKQIGLDRWSMMMIVDWWEMHERGKLAPISVLAAFE